MGRGVEIFRCILWLHGKRVLKTGDGLLFGVERFS